MDRRSWLSVVVLAFALAWGAKARADLAHDTVSGRAIERVSLRGGRGGPKTLAWTDLSAPKTPGSYTIRFVATADAVLVPHCNGRDRVLVDGAPKDAGSKGPLVLRLGDDAPRETTIDMKVSAYHKRIGCSEPRRVGAALRSTDGLSTMRFESPHATEGGGDAVVCVPGGHEIDVSGSKVVIRWAP
jgi:hypothetical protein